jgi:hypothetical protein
MIKYLTNLLGYLFKYLLLYNSSAEQSFIVLYKQFFDFINIPRTFDLISHLYLI